MGRVARDEPALAAGRESLAAADGFGRPEQFDRAPRLPRAV
jgi:hypothetical protein